MNGLQKGIIEAVRMAKFSKKGQGERCEESLGDDDSLRALGNTG